MHSETRFERWRRIIGADDRLPIDPDLAPDDPGEPSSEHRPAAVASHRGDLRVLGIIGLGGVLGTLARYGVGLALPAPAGAFPLATFAVNTSGAFLLGFVLTLILERFPHSKYLRPLSCVGILGAWTTMSSFVTEADLLAFHSHRVGIALAYIGATFAAGIVATVIGIAFGRHCAGRP